MWPTPGSPPRSLRGSRVRLRPARRSRHPPLVHPPWRPPVKPGESYTYEFTVPNAGSHMYHSHHNAAIQVGARPARRVRGGAEAGW